MNVLVIGASRGLGFEFVKQYCAAGARVTATARSDAGLEVLSAAGATALWLDVANAESASRLAWQIDGEAFDVVLFCPGVYGPRTSDLAPPTEAEFIDVMTNNVLGAMRVLPSLADAFAPGATLAVISSRMGAIGPRTASSGWLYRASKAALNSVLKDVSLAFAGRCVSIAFHPGWVQTDMGGAEADLTPAQSVASMRRVLSGLTAADNGRFIDHDGTPIDW